MAQYGRLIGLVGLKQSGKDTAAQALVSQGWVRMAFADPLKEMSLHLRGVHVWVPHDTQERYDLAEYVPYHEVVERLGMDTAKEAVPDVRVVLQTLGTDCVRATFGNRTWTDLTGDRVRQALEQGQDIVLTDVRFNEELGLVRELHGTSVGIVRGDTLPDIADAVDVHPTETATYRLLHEVDALVFNNGTIKDLYRSITELIQGR